jgi:glycosyltransferase involved in cell wall biosynthesis
MTLSEIVSVIIPVFNGAAFLAEAIESVRQQRFGPLEIIIVDDGSTDGSFDLAEGMAEVQCFRQDNKGPAAARNLGVQRANGSLLAFLDADDLWTKEKLALQMAALRNDPSLNLVAGRVEEFGTDSSELVESRRQRRNGDRAYTIGALLLSRADFLKVGTLNPALKFGEFIDWRSRAIIGGMKELVLDEVVLRRRIHDRNTTLRSTDSSDGYLATLRAHLRRKRTQGSSPEIRQEPSA